MSKQLIVSLRAAPPTDRFEPWNQLSTLSEGGEQKLSHLGLKHKLLLLGYRKGITQHHTVRYCLQLFPGYRLNPG